jgi:PQQ-dependent dehydrogenase (methanol/ethanol family)
MKQVNTKPSATLVRRVWVTLTAVLVAVCLFFDPARAQKGGDWRAAPAKDFPLAGGNLANQRYSTLASITPGNVSKLGGAWMLHVNGGEGVGNLEATPVVVDGVMYVPASGGVIMAIDAATGAVKWKHASTGGRGTNRGVVAAEGKVFSSGGGNTLVALDQKDGALLWTTKVGDRGSTAAPAIYYDGLVYMGVAGGEAGIRGFFGAFDAKTGKQVWGFWTIPGPGERGNDTWEGTSWNHGGGPVWTHPVIDPDLGMIYVPVGNCAPDNDGTERGGDNLFTASLVALDMKTGAYKWHYQEVHHDVWDYDNSGSPVLADIEYKGQTRKIVMHAGKTGFLYILDRANGKPLIGIEERPVPQEPRMKTAKTQPFPIGDSFVPTCPEPDSVAPGVKSACIFAAYWDEAVVTTPGTLGGLSWAPMTYSPLTHLIYIPGSIINSGYGLRREAWDEDGHRLQPAPGGGRGIGYFRPAGEPRAGTLTAIDPTTNKIVWQKRNKYPMGVGSGLLSTAAGLIFHGESDGRIVAYDIVNGSELWSFQTGAGADAPVIAYAVGGQEYVAILSGGNSFQLSQRGDNLWAFKLGGTLPPAPAPAAPPTTQPGPRGPGGQERP